MNRYALILAGGSGKRLWPLGRQKLPKQLIPFQENRTLLDITIARMALVVPRENIWVVTILEYATVIRATCGDKVGRVVVEPEARNTGPAIFYALQELQKRDSSAMLIVAPSDQVINDIKNFVKTIEVSCNYAQSHSTIVSCGVVPTHPATGYGYIEMENMASETASVRKFHEKPTSERALEYIKSGMYLWNTGIFCATVQTLSDEFKKLTPNEYAALPTQSIDYMIFEKSDALSVVKGAFDWSDVGTLDLFIASKKVDHENIVAVNAHNVLVHGTKKLVVILDVDDICIIETDDVLFITKRAETEKIRGVVDYLKANGYEEFI